MTAVEETLGEGWANLNEDNAQQCAADWVKIADLDGNGTISFDEFKEFFVKLDESKFAEAALREAFDSIDTDGDGELDTQEFGNAILATLKGE